jgi:hypothetical protein
MATVEDLTFTLKVDARPALREIKRVKRSMRPTFGLVEIVLFALWAHVNGAALAYAIVDDSHGRPYPERLLVLIACALLAVLYARLILRWRSC